MENFYEEYLKRLGIDDGIADYKDNTVDGKDNCRDICSSDSDETALISPEYLDKHCVYMIRYKKNNKYWYRVGFTEDIQLVINKYFDIDILYLFITKNQNFEIVLKYKIYESKIDIIDGNYEVSHTIFNLLDTKYDYKNPFYTIDINNNEMYCDIAITNKSTRLNQTNYLQDSIPNFPSIFS